MHAVNCVRYCCSSSRTTPGVITVITKDRVTDDSLKN